MSNEEKQEQQEEAKTGRIRLGEQMAQSVYTQYRAVDSFVTFHKLHNALVSESIDRAVTASAEYRDAVAAEGDDSFKAIILGLAKVSLTAQAILLVNVMSMATAEVGEGASFHDLHRTFLQVLGEQLTKFADAYSFDAPQKFADLFNKAGDQQLATVEAELQKAKGGVH